MDVYISELQKHFTLVADFILVRCESQKVRENVRQELMSRGFLLQFNSLDTGVFWLKVYINQNCSTTYQLKMKVATILNAKFPVTVK